MEALTEAVPVRTYSAVVEPPESVGGVRDVIEPLDDTTEVVTPPTALDIAYASAATGL
jgi:hypothetical protein